MGYSYSIYREQQAFFSVLSGTGAAHSQRQPTSTQKKEQMEYVATPSQGRVERVEDTGG